MGRGNACVHGEYEGLYYIDWNNFQSEFEDDDGKYTDYDAQFEEWTDALDNFIDDFTDMYKSFTKCGEREWISNYERAVMESSLFYIVVEDNEWSMAIKLIQKDQDYYGKGNIENLQKKHYQTYLEGMKKCLFNQFEEIGVYGGAWSSGRIRKSEAAA